MARTQIECYTLFLNKRGKPEELEDIAAFGIDKLDLLQVFGNKLIVVDASNLADQNNQKYLEIRMSTLNNVDRGNYGTFTYGSFGTGGKIKDSTTGDLRYVKSTTDTETKPFYFQWHIPDNKRQRKKGFLIIQRYGVEGLKTSLSKYLKKTVSDLHQGVVLNIAPVLPKTVFEHLINNGIIKELIFKEYSFPNNIARRLQIPDHNVKDLYVEVAFKAKRNSGINIAESLSQIFNSGSSRLYSLGELNSLGFNDLSQREVIVNLNGKSRRIKLNDIGSLTPYLDIDNEIEKDTDNFPVLASIHKVAQEYLNDLMTEFYS